MTRDNILNELKNIAEKPPVSNLFINIYLNLNHKDLNQTVKNKAFIRKSFKLIENTLPSHGDVEKNYLKFLENFWNTFENIDKSSKGAYIMGYNNNLNVFILNIPLERQLILTTRPYILYLEKIILNHPDVNILLIDSKTAKFFYHSLGRSVFLNEITSDVPGRMKRGGWSQMKYERHIKDHIHWHFKKIIQEMEQIYAYKNKHAWVVFGHHELTTQFRKLLPKNLESKVIGSAELDIKSNINLIENKTNNFAHKKIEFTEEKNTNNLIISAKKNQKAVLGLNAVLAALNEKNIDKLIINDNFKAKGFFCTKYKIFQATSNCACENGYLKEKNLEEAIIEEVLKNEGQIEFTDSVKLIKEGGIGAYLRF